MRRSKYGAKKVEVDGIIFDSKKEARRYKELVSLQEQGAISYLQRQVKFILFPAQYEECDEVFKSGPRKGEKKQGKLLERECSYVADFVYFDEKTQHMVVEDTKGMRTPEYIVKRKAMLSIHHIKIKEV